MSMTGAARPRSRASRSHVRIQRAVVVFDPVQINRRFGAVAVGHPAICLQRDAFDKDRQRNAATALLKRTCPAGVRQNAVLVGNAVNRGARRHRATIGTQTHRLDRWRVALIGKPDFRTSVLECACVVATGMGNARRKNHTSACNQSFHQFSLPNILAQKSCTHRHLARKNDSMKLVFYNGHGIK